MKESASRAHRAQAESGWAACRPSCLCRVSTCRAHCDGLFLSAPSNTNSRRRGRRQQVSRFAWPSAQRFTKPVKKMKRKAKAPFKLRKRRLRAGLVVLRLAAISCLHVSIGAQLLGRRADRYVRSVPGPRRARRLMRVPLADSKRLGLLLGRDRR